MWRGQALFALTITVVLSGCGFHDVVKYEPPMIEGNLIKTYTLTHKDGHEVKVIHKGNTVEAIEEYCKYGLACAAPSNSCCLIWAHNPTNTTTQSIWDHEEAHCMGWIHKDGYTDPTYLKAQQVGK